MDRKSKNIRTNSEAWLSIKAQCVILIDPKNVPSFLIIYIYCFNWNVSNLFAVEDLLIYVLLLVKISKNNL